MKQIAELLERARLVTLTGVGGCGKTRLALEAARLTRNNFSGGVWLVELASVADPEQVVKSVAGALPVAQRDQLDPLRVVFDFLEERHALLLLDNCEHLLDAVAALTMSLLRAAPGVRILATSRESLGVPGELPFVVSPLDTIDPDRLPPLGVLRRIEAIRLFVERAGALRPDFALTEASAGAVARICRRLDGIPLAIELAAARIRVLAVEQILERLAQRFQLLTGGSPLAPPRQQTLRATIEWSYRLLDEQERRLVRRLAVFSGGWTMAAAERVCAGEGIATGDVLDLLSHLVDKSWVVTVATNKEIRFRQLETIRMYALERFLESDEVADVRNRHLASFVAWAEKLRPEYFREEWYEARAEAERELENVRGALSWSLESGDAEAGMRLAVALFDIWDTGRQEEGRRWLERGLEHRTALPARLLSDTLDRAGFLAARLDDFATALARFGESVVVAQDVGDHRRRARSVLNLAIVHSWCGRFEVAERHWLEARELFARVGDERGIMDTFQISGTCFLLQRDFMRSRAAYSQAMKMARKMGNKRAVDHLCGGLGFAEVHMGHVETAKALFRQGMQGGGQLVHAFLGLAMVAAREGRFVRAGHLIGMLDRLQASPVQHALPQKAAAVSGAVARTIADIRARGDKRVFDAARAEGRRVTLQRAIAYALEEVEGGTFRVVP